MVDEDKVRKAVEELEKLDEREQERVMKTEDSLRSWLRSVASKIWDLAKTAIGTAIGTVTGIFFG